MTDAADAVVWLDLPLALKLGRLWRRTSHRIRNHVELWNGNHESWRSVLWGWDSLVPWTIRAHFRHRREYPRRYASHSNFVRLRSTREVRLLARRRRTGLSFMKQRSIRAAVSSTAASSTAASARAARPQ